MEKVEISLNTSKEENETRKGGGLLKVTWLRRDGRGKKGLLEIPAQGTFPQRPLLA